MKTGPFGAKHCSTSKEIPTCSFTCMSPLDIWWWITFPTRGRDNLRGNWGHLPAFPWAVTTARCHCSSLAASWHWPGCFTYRNLSHRSTAQRLKHQVGARPEHCTSAVGQDKNSSLQVASGSWCRTLLRAVLTLILCRGREAKVHFSTREDTCWFLPTSLN